MEITDDAVRAACRARTVTLPGGVTVPQLGQGTWKMGEHPSSRARELEALRTGVGLGMTLIDTAEMYGEGNSEQLIGEAIRGMRRDELFLVSKVYPRNAGGARMIDSCKASLRRLGVDYLDLYLLHWRGGYPLSETVACFEQLMSEGLIRAWGVSNFDTADMQELWRTPGGDRCALNQVLYHLGSRGVEYDLLPWMRAHHVPLMAYCPVAQGGSLRSALLKNAEVSAVARRHGLTPIQVLLCFVLSREDVITIPKAASAAHVRLNAQTALMPLTKAELAALSAAFPAPSRKTALDIV